MLEQLMDLLHLAFRQKDAVYRTGRLLTGLFTGGFSLKRVAALLVAAAEMLACVISDTPLTPLGGAPDLTGYALVFSDDFDGDALDPDVWRLRYNGPYGGGFSAAEQARVQDGNLIITGEYREDGPFGPGWYACDLALRQTYKRGYFEIRCKCGAGGDFWSAFWIQAEHPYEHDLSNGGINGCELDIFEAPYALEQSAVRRNAIVQTVHCNGWDDDPDHIDSRILGKFKVEDPYDSYHTYALEWTETEYIFYIDGVESARSSFGKGVSQVEETVCVSMCIPSEMTIDRGVQSVYTVDYVKIWQKP